MNTESERDKAKAAVKSSSENDPEFDSAMSGAHRFELEKRRDDQAHTEKMAKADRGWFGTVFGNSEAAASNAAFIVIFSGVLMAFVCMLLAHQTETPNSLNAWAERSIALVATALAYLFGRSSA